VEDPLRVRRRRLHRNDDNEDESDGTLIKYDGNERNGVRVDFGGQGIHRKTTGGYQIRQGLLDDDDKNNNKDDECWWLSRR